MPAAVNPNGPSNNVANPAAGASSSTPGQANGFDNAVQAQETGNISDFLKGLSGDQLLELLLAAVSQSGQGNQAQGGSPTGQGSGSGGGPLEALIEAIMAEMAAREQAGDGTSNNGASGGQGGPTGGSTGQPTNS